MLLASAERLFAERGIDAVSLAEVNAVAGQRNTSAVHYHFGNKAGLVEAVVAPHLEEIDVQRQALLNELEPMTTAGLRDLLTVLVRPLAAKLDTASGRCFLRLQAQGGPKDLVPWPATARLVALVKKATGGWMPRAISQQRADLLQLLLFPALATRASLEEQKGRAARGRALFVENLIDALVGILETPVSESTRTITTTFPRRRERSKKSSNNRKDSGG